MAGGKHNRFIHSLYDAPLISKLFHSSVMCESAVKKPRLDPSDFYDEDSSLTSCSDESRYSYQGYETGKLARNQLYISQAAFTPIVNLPIPQLGSKILETTGPLHLPPPTAARTLMGMPQMSSTRSSTRSTRSPLTPAPARRGMRPPMTHPLMPRQVLSIFDDSLSLSDGLFQCRTSSCP